MMRRRNPHQQGHGIDPRLLAADGARYFSDAALAEADHEAAPSKSRTALVLMHPRDFLAMAEPGKREESQAALERVLGAGTRLSDVPRLFIDVSRGNPTVAVVTGHEGRHRSRALLARGVTQMPVRLHSLSIRWGEQTDPESWDYEPVLPSVLVGEGANRQNTLSMPVPLHYPELAPRLRRALANPRRNPEDDYRMRHRPSEGERAHELGAEWLPDDVHVRPELYTGFRELLPEFWPVLRSAQGKPRKMIDIYRALPKPHTTFRTGDWVTLSPSYAVMHLRHSVSEGGHVIKASVPADTLRFAGDDLMEWGYWGPTIEGEPRSWLRNPRNPQTETAAFKKWFGDSKVVDAQGKPLVVYHGTSATFDTFDVGLSWDGGFHFGTAEAATNRIADGAGLDPERWSTYFSVSPSIMPVYLSIKRPLRLNYDPIDEETWAFVIGEAKDNGYDGVVYPNSVEGGESWVAFDARQIKSATGNAGTFDPDDASILRNPRTRRTRSRR